MNKKIFTFLGLLILSLIYPYYKAINLGLDNATMYVFIIMWLPAIIAIITNLIIDKKFPNFNLKPLFSKELSFAYLIPVLSCIIVYCTVYVTGLGGINLSLLDISNTSDLIKTFLLISTVGVIGSMLTAAGEELGWRGFLFPELMKKYSFIKSSLIVGLIWLLYHLPLLIFSDYNNGVSVISSLICFSISVFAITFIANILRLKSTSVWPCIMIHAVHNVFVQSFFDKITVDKGITKLITTEFGVGLALIYTLVALFLYKYNKRKNII